MQPDETVRADDTRPVDLSAIAVAVASLDQAAVVGVLPRRPLDDEHHGSRTAPTPPLGALDRTGAPEAGRLILVAPAEQVNRPVVQGVLAYLGPPLPTGDDPVVRPSALRRLWSRMFPGRRPR